MLSKNLSLDLAIIGEIVKTFIVNPSLLFESRTARVMIAQHRLNLAKQKGFVNSLPDSVYNIKNTATHNLHNLSPSIAANRPMALLGPLLAIDKVAFNLKSLKVLIIGPRTEAEIFMYLDSGFAPGNIYALDLITYSELITQGDMHSMPFDDDFFDIIVFSWVLGYSNDQQLAVNEAIRVVKCGGLLGIGEQWTPMDRDEVSSKMMENRGYSLKAVETRSSQDLEKLLGGNLKKTVFQTEPVSSEKSRVGWITLIGEINKI